MNVTDALATSPNTAFAKLISQVGVQRTVDMAVKLGLRSYALPGTARDYDPESNESLADFVKRQNLGSFTLGPIEVNALELSNVAATLASGGMWCPPNPIAEVIDRDGKQVSVTTETCEQVVPEGLANTLANAMSKDDTGAGTAAGSAGSVGWDLPMSGKTGTTEASRSSGFVGFTNQYAAANYIYDDSTAPGALCSFPLRQCGGDGNLFGGNEPARTWFTAMKPIANNFGPVSLPPTDPRYVDGAPGSRVPSVVGSEREHRAAAAARSRFPGRRRVHAGQQRRVVRNGGWHVAGRADGSWFDHHDPDLQRHPAGATAAPAGRDTGPSAAGRADGGPDSRAAAHHGAGAGSAAATSATTAPGTATAAVITLWCRPTQTPVKSV